MSSAEPLHVERLKNKTARNGIWIFLFVVGMALWLACLLKGGEAPRAWRAFLINFAYFTPIAGGMVVWSAVVRTSRGNWDGPLEGTAFSGITFALPSFAALIALWISSPQWAPWFGRKDLPQGLWFQETFVFGRNLAALTIFWLLAMWYVAQRRRGGGKVLAGFLIFTYCMVFSLIGFDLIMALDPRWYSALFGGYFFISGMYGAAAAWTVVSLRRPEADANRLHDLGKLIVTFSLLTTYMMFSQLLPIWYGNLPAETRFVVPRMNFYPWAAVSIALLAVVYLGPLALLLTVRGKRTRWYLGTIALLILVGLWVERWWLVAPTFHRELKLGLTELSISAAYLGIFGFLLDRNVAGPQEGAGEEAKTI